MKCTNCGANLKDGVLFCRECGCKVTKKILFCRNCREELRPNDKFCSNCGEPVRLAEEKGVDNNDGISTIVEVTADVDKNDEDILLDDMSEPVEDNFETISVRPLHANNTQIISNKEPKNSLKDKIVSELSRRWSLMDVFTKICSVISLFLLLLVIFSPFMHKTTSLALGLLGAGSTIYAFLLHTNKAKNKNKWMKYVCIVVSLLMIFLGFKGLFDKSYKKKTTKKAVDPSKLVIPSLSLDSQTNDEEGIYVYEVRNYVGKNLATIGDEINHKLYDRYGKSGLKIVLINQDAMFIDAEDTELLKNYVVLSQSIEPGTSFMTVCKRNSDGEPSSYGISYNNYDEIELYVGKVGEDTEATELTKINPVLDRHTYYVRNYVGKNLASFGYSYVSYRTDDYGDGRIKLSYITEDGSYIEPTDDKILRQFYVTEQEPSPNTEINLTYRVDSNGVESDYYVTNESVDEIILHVKKLDESVLALYPEDEETDLQYLNTDQVEIGESYSSFNYKDYKDVQKTLEKEGFTNISTTVVYDIVWGWTSEGEIASVSIDGNEKFEKGDVFNKDAEIIITYHMKKDDDPNEKDKESNNSSKPEPKKDTFEDLQNYADKLQAYLESTYPDDYKFSVIRVGGVITVNLAMDNVKSTGTYALNYGGDYQKLWDKMMDTCLNINKKMTDGLKDSGLGKYTMVLELSDKTETNNCYAKFTNGRKTLDAVDKSR